MANYQQLKNALVDVIKQNGNNEITGEIMQTTLLSMINSLGANYQFAGVLTPSTSFIPTDENIFYIGGAGSYINFGASTINVPTGCICVFTYNGSFASSILYVGGVVDISKLTNTSYANLSQALADVPSFLQVGGLEVMYQDSTSGKYDKYRLMTTSWSTTISDWQGEANFNDVFNVNAYNNKLDAYTSEEIARNAIPSSKRKYGMIIVYLLSSGWVVEQYQGNTSLANAEWQKSTNWVSSGMSNKQATILTVADTSDVQLNSFITKTNNTYLFFNNTSGIVDLAIASDGTTYFTIANDLRSGGIAEYTYISSGKPECNQIKVVLKAGFGGSIFAVNKKDFISALECMIASTNKDLQSINRPLNWSQGSIVTSGANIGQISPNALRTNIGMFVNEGDTHIFGVLKNNYKINIFEWDGVSDTMVTSGWFSESIIEFTPKLRYFYVVAGNGTDTSVNVSDIVSNVHLSISSIGLADYISKYKNITHNWQQGGIVISGDNIGTISTNALRSSVIARLEVGSVIMVSVNSNFILSIYEWDGVSSSMNKTTDIYSDYAIHITEYENVYLSVINKSYSAVTPQIANSNVKFFANSSLNELLKLQENYNKEQFDGNKYPLTNWQQGTPNADGEPDGTTNRIMTTITDMPQGEYFYSIKDGYDLAIQLRNNEGVLKYSSGWLLDTGKKLLINDYKVIFIIKKTNNSTINIGEGGFAVTISGMSLASIKGINPIENSYLEYWQQGGVYTSGTNIGKLGQNHDIRCTKILSNVPSGTCIAYSVKTGYKIAIHEWDGEATTFNKINSFDTFYQDYGNYITTYPNVYVVIGRTTDADIDADNVLDNVQLVVSKRLNALSVGIGQLENEYRKYNIPYLGESLPFGQKMSFIDFTTFVNWENSQGGAVYGDYLVSCLAMDEVASGHNANLFNLATKQKICELTFGNTLNGKTYTMPHANQVCFGTEFYNENSVFPLLYVSQTTLYSTEANKGELGVLVYDIQKVSDFEYTPVLVQAIIPDLSDTEFRNIISNWTTNYIVDTDNNMLYLVGYPRMWDTTNIQTMQETTKGNYPFTKFVLPSISDGAEVVLGIDDIKEHFIIKRETAIQQMVYNKGYIYIQGGFSGDNTDKYFDSISLPSHCLSSQINLSSYRNLEPQFIGIYKDKLLWYDAGTTGKIEEMIFN